MVQPGGEMRKHSLDAGNSKTKNKKSKGSTKNKSSKSNKSDNQEVVINRDQGVNSKADRVTVNIVTARKKAVPSDAGSLLTVDPTSNLGKEILCEASSQKKNTKMMERDSSVAKTPKEEYLFKFGCSKEGQQIPKLTKGLFNVMLGRHFTQERNSLRRTVNWNMLVSSEVALISFLTRLTTTISP